MKRKLLISALALPAVFAACTQEDVLEMNSNNVQERVALENVTFELAPESRFAFDGTSFNSYVAKSGDAVGAYLIDTPADIKTDAELAAKRATQDVTNWDVESFLLGGYTPATSIQGSFKWVYDGSTFTTLDKMVEGQYLYVAPYQEKATREPITTEIPQLMQLKYKEGTTELNDNSLLDALAESGTPVAVGYEFLSRYDSNVNGQLKQIYAYPRITFKNMLEEAVTVQKFVIKSASKIALKGEIVLHNQNGSDAIDVLKRYDSDEDDAQSGNWIKAKAGNWYATENYTKDIVKFDNASKVGFLVVMAPENYSVAAGKTMAFQAVLPAAEYDDLAIDVYTDKGVFQAILGAGLKFNNGLRYSSSNYEDGTLIEDVAADAQGNDGFTRGSDVAIENESATVPTEGVVVVNASDLIDVINGTAAGTVASPTDINVLPMTTVEVNGGVVSALGDKKKLTVNEVINVVGTEEGITLKNILFKAGANVTEGKVTFGNNAKIQGSKTLTVNAGCEVVVDGVLNANGNALIANNGTLAINKQQTIKSLTNAGTLTINKFFNDDAQTVVGTATIETLVNGEAASMVVADGAKAVVSAMSGYGDVTINTGATAQFASEGYNGDVENNGTFDGSVAFTSNGDWTNNGAFSGSAFVNDGNFYNNYTAGVVTIATNGVTKDGDLDASAVIIPADGSKTTVTNNYGTIKYNAKAMTAEVTNHGVQSHLRYGHVEFTFDGANSEELSAAYNKNNCTKLVLAKDFEIKSGNPITLEEIKVIEITGGTITMNENQTLYHCPMFIAGDVTLTGEKTLYSDVEITVDQTAKLTVFAGTIQGYTGYPTNPTLANSINFRNNGTVENFGKILGVNTSSNLSWMTKLISTTPAWTSKWAGNGFNVAH